MTRQLSRRLVAGCSLSAVMALVAGCTSNAPVDSTTTGDGDRRSVSVVANDKTCTVSASSAPAGNLRFAVRNDGTQVTEFYLLTGDGHRILAEVENIGPGLSRDLVLNAVPGQYLTACKPGMVGDGTRAPFVVTGTPPAQTGGAAETKLLDAATTRYAGYIRSQTRQLLSRTERFRRLYLAGEDAKARALYPVARGYWERVEPVAESFGDLDPKMDAREADVEAGAPWTGWHRIEKDLWPARAKGYRPLDQTARTQYVNDLLANTQELYRRTLKTTFTVDQIANGSKTLLDEVATGKVTGEEERWSRTDLWDFQANVEGARAGFDVLRPVLQQKDPALDRTLDQHFVALDKLLAAQRKGAGFRSYDELSRAEVKHLSDAVNALSEPLSHLTAAVI